MTDLALLYIARGHGGGLLSVRAFAEAYRKHAAGEPHDLYFLAKGWPDPAERRALVRVAESCGARIVELPDDGFDWAAYFRGADRLSHRYLCLMNLHARPLHDDWLAALAQPVRTSGAIVSATGSWESLRPLAAACDRPDVKWRKFVRSGLLSLRYPAFPNHHLRSNAMVLEREVLLAFAGQSAIPRSKRDAFMLESGRRGLSAFAAARRIGLLIAGADGAYHEPLDWPGAGTFRVPGQPNLLVADNRTLDYAYASPDWRRALEYVTWGRHFTQQTGA